jgi:16S rRNA (cytidine1402-2'-O)-methyltransferase
MPGTLFVVATPIGNLEDITMRALRVLGEVAIIAAEDTRRTAKLLARYAIVTPTTSLHEHNEAAKTAPLITRLQAGESIAVVSDAGTPTVSDPGGVLIRAAIDAGIRVEPVPGPSAVLAALSASGLPTVSFAFLGFPPTRSSDRNAWFERMRDTRGTVVFLRVTPPYRGNASGFGSSVWTTRGRAVPRTHQGSRNCSQRTYISHRSGSDHRDWGVHCGPGYW